MNWINLAMIILFSTAITGSSITLVWLVINRMTVSSGNARYLYMLLRGTVCGYLFPLLVLTIYSAWYFFSSHDIAFFTWENSTWQYFAVGISLIWLLGIVVIILREIRKQRRFAIILRSSLPASIDLQQMKQELARELGIDHPIHLMQGYGVESPFICGYRNCCIYLPVHRLQEKDLRIILRHELTHFLQRDVLWKPLFSLIRTIYWFSPLAWYQEKMMGRWAEASCDAACCAEKIKPKEYFQLLDRMSDLEEVNPLRSTVSSWCENKQELTWRVLCMKRLPGKKVTKWMTAVMVGVSIILGALITGATIEFVNSIYDKATWKTAKLDHYPTSEKLNSSSAMPDNNVNPDTLQKYEIQEGDWIEDWISKKNRISSINLDWIVEKGKTFATTSIKAESGEHIGIYITGKDKTRLRLGIVSEKKEEHSILIKRDGLYYFDISKPGQYRVFVQNKTGHDIKISAICKKKNRS